MIGFEVNGSRVSVDADPKTPLLWVVREHLKLTGTKFGCGAGLCGACTVHLNGAAVRSCTTNVLKGVTMRHRTSNASASSGRHGFSSCSTYAPSGTRLRNSLPSSHRPLANSVGESMCP